MRKYETENHTFVISAYKESKYLSNCIRSLLAQSMKSNILITTATPNDYIDRIAKRYDVPVIVRESGIPNIADDWNFAYQNAETELVTIAHQDDIYHKQYVEVLLQSLNREKKPLIFFSHYGEIRGSEKVYHNKLLRIKRILLLPLQIAILQNSIFVRRCILSLGSPICCPSVTYVKNALPETLFRKGFCSNLDWEAWEKISKYKGGFIYHQRPLMLHRIHEESETSNLLARDGRTKEDYEMFCKFWNPIVAKRIVWLYRKSQGSNDTRSK